MGYCCCLPGRCGTDWRSLIKWGRFVPGRVRFTGIATTRELSAIFSGGIAPFVATALLARSHGSYVPIAVYVIVTCLITTAALLWSDETYRKAMNR